MNKLPRSAGAAALAAAAVAAGALASACGSGPATFTQQHPQHATKAVVTKQHTSTKPSQQGSGGSQTSSSGAGSGSGGTGGSQQGNGSGNTPPPPPPPPPVPQTITIDAPTAVAPVPATPTGSQLPASQIPWGQVGSGWTVAMWNPNLYTAGHGLGQGVSDLMLVSPSGQGYAVDAFPAGVEPTIDDWSGNKQNVLISVYDGYNSSATVMDINLVNGTTVSRMGIPDLKSVSFTHPEGTGLLIQQGRPNGSNDYVLARTNLEGRVELTFPTTGPGLYTADGTQLVIGASAGLQVITNGGAVVADLPVPAAAGGCTPDSWWGPDQVLATCQTANSSDYDVVSMSGGAPLQLGTAIGWAPYGLVEHMDGSIFANLPACSTIELMKLVNGQWQNESIPGAVSGSSQIIVGAYNGLLEVDATPSCGENKIQEPSLFWYDPANNTSDLFFGATHGGGIVYDALGYLPYPATQDLPVASA